MEMILKVVEAVQGNCRMDFSMDWNHLESLDFGGFRQLATSFY
jgi:hypothetical protein